MSDGIFDFLEESNTLKVNPYPWMTDGTHKFVLGTAENLPSIIDECIASGLYSLDLETTGLDNRVFDGETVAKIVGCCISADGVTGYYIPLRHKLGVEHNVPWSLFRRELTRLIESPARAIFHHGKFDQEFLQFNGGEPLGEWDDPKKWEDTLILAYLKDTRQKQIGLKHLSETILGMKMIELKELFPEDVRKQGHLDFSELDPSWQPVLWYGASDAICTWKLYPRLSKEVLQPEDGNNGQAAVYAIEKLCVASTRWMERARIMMDQDKAKELIRIGQREWIASLDEVFKSSSEIVGRDVRPGYYRLMAGMVEGHTNKFDTEQVSPSYMDRVEEYRKEATKLHLDPMETKGKKSSVQTVTKRVASIATKGASEDIEFPLVYDPLSPQQLGQLLRECKVPGLTVTEKSGQVSTAAEEMDRVLEEQGNKFPFAGKIKRFREVGKALSTYLIPIIEDCAPDGSLRANFNAHKIDTGRFNCKASKDHKHDGGTRFPFHGTPATYDPSRPECMGRIRECVISRPGKILAAIDFSGVELRIVTNISREPKWLREFFHCSGCDHMFDAGDGSATPLPPPPFCPVCGSDKIGDLHTLTGLSIYGADAINRPEWKMLRGQAKGTNFALCYGGSGNAVITATGCDKQEGWRIKDQFDKTYMRLAAWWKEQHTFARKNKYVATAFGRRYPLPDIDHEQGMFRAKAERNAINGPVQGCLNFDSRIPTSLGLLTVKELWDRQVSGEYDRFKVWTGKGWSEGRALFSGLKALRVTSFDRGHETRTSPEHLFRVWSGEEFTWVRQQELTQGTWVATSAPTQPLVWDKAAPEYHWESGPKKVHNAKDFSIRGNHPTLWEYLGMVYGDGSIQENDLRVHVGGNVGFPSFSAEAHAQEWVHRLNRDLEVGAILEGPVVKKTSTQEGRLHLPIWKVTVLNKSFRTFCRDVLGVEDQNTYTKRFPRALWSESVENRAAFLRGYFSTDGTVVGSSGKTRIRRGKEIPRRDTPTFSVRSVNEGLLRDTHDLLGSLGIRSSCLPKSKRVDILDRLQFRELVGYNIPYKTSRAEGLKTGFYYSQRHLCPPTLVQAVGRLVKDSSIYKDLPQPQKSAVHRLLIGSGSKPQCLTYLQKMPEVEIPQWVWEALKYDYVRVQKSVDAQTVVDMYDIEVFDDDHAFVCDGLVVHNTSADITKLSMGAIYKECKARGWLEKVHMLITMHDELVFEIDKDILAEAIETFVQLMNRHPALIKLRWPIPLTSDVEMGLNWMVPWDLKKLKKSHKWPDEIKGLFPDSEAGSHEETHAVESKPQKKTDAVRTHQIKSFGQAEILALAEVFCQEITQPAVLKVLGPNGDDITSTLMIAWGGILPEVQA